MYARGAAEVPRPSRRFELITMSMIIVLLMNIIIVIIIVIIIGICIIIISSSISPALRKGVLGIR